MDSSGTTYFSPPPYITDTLTNIDLYLPDIIKNNDNIEKTKENVNVNKWANNNTFENEFLDALVSIMLHQQYLKLMCYISINYYEIN